MPSITTGSLTPSGTDPVTWSQAQSNFRPQAVPGRIGRNRDRSRSAKAIGSAEVRMAASSSATVV